MVACSTPRRRSTIGRSGCHPEPGAGPDSGFARDVRRSCKKDLDVWGPSWAHCRFFPSGLGTPLDPDNVSHWFSPNLQAGPPRPLPPARAAPLRGIVDPGPGHRPLRGLRSSRTLEHRHHERCVRASGRRPETRSCNSYVRGAADAEWLPQWLPEPTCTGRGCWLNQRKRDLTRPNIGAPGGIRTPNLLIRRSARGVHCRTPRSIYAGKRMPRSLIG
jgi:hypothetical protein